MRDRRFQAFLFDMDGTVLTSIEAANRVWSRWAIGRGLDERAVLAVMHGVRAEDTVRRFAPDSDVVGEARRITEQEMAEIEGVHEVAGAGAFLAALPPERWAIVTSAPRRLALRRLTAAGLPAPAVLIGAEDVACGKPDPEPYRKAASDLGVDMDRCLVWEDAPAGIASGLAAGAAVIVVGADLPPDGHDLPAVLDFRSLRAGVEAEGTLSLQGVRLGRAGRT